MRSIQPTASQARASNQTLLIDADDTLWENSIHFERAIASFISYLDHHVHTADEVRQHLNICERATIADYGYGLQSFRRSLIDCFEQLSESPVTPEHHTRIVSFAEEIAASEIELLPAVDTTLQKLHQRHRLILVTKGDIVEQTSKLERSGLSLFFNHVEVLAEKDAAAYRDILVRHNCNAASTWMIGNSPKSDINSALAAGLNAVFIPHNLTWALEHEIVDQPSGAERLLELEAFSELIHWF